MFLSPRGPDELLLELHRLVDEATAEVAESHGKRLRCGPGCGTCCEDDLAVYEVEAARLRAHCADLLSTGVPHPPGACAFLDEGGSCRVYDDRPYVCRTHGLPLRWIEALESGELAEMREICPLNQAGDPPLEDMDEEVCWTIGPFEGRLAALQTVVGHGELTRVPLRSLFER